MTLLAPTSITGISMWSRWQPDRALNFNSFVVRGTETIVVDPLLCEAADVEAIRAQGGAAWIVLTNRDHERESRALAQALGANIAAPAADAPQLSGPVDRELHDGESIGDARVIALSGMKSPGECALYIERAQAVIVGDALIAHPAGQLRLLPDEKLGDPRLAVLSLRALRGLQPRHLLAGDGACIFEHATAAIDAALRARADVCAQKINIDELSWRSSRAPRPYGASSAEIGFLIGAAKLGYQLVRIPPGTKVVPFHWHTGDEEFYFIVEGEPLVRTPLGEYACRKGDFIAFPADAAGAHTIRNATDRECLVLMVATTDGNDVCTYPDSNKVLIERDDLLVRRAPELAYLDGETETPP